MSAFIVGTETMNRVVSFLLNNVESFAGVPTFTTGSPEGIGSAIGQLLYRLNTDAVNQRYGEREESPGPRYAFKMVSVTDIQAYKSIGCLMYQCSEGDVPERPLFRQLSEVHGELAHRIVGKLEAYDRAEWG